MFPSHTKLVMSISNDQRRYYIFILVIRQNVPKIDVGHRHPVYQISGHSVCRTQYNHEDTEDLEVQGFHPQYDLSCKDDRLFNVCGGGEVFVNIEFM